ncbi:MAG: hypothetical protein EBV45_17000, partial [Chloroflexi bacterium]|nr:hypothetical protein [Chloroflexota bacterium]
MITPLMGSSANPTRSLRDGAGAGLTDGAVAAGREAPRGAGEAGPGPSDGAFAGAFAGAFDGAPAMGARIGSMTASTGGDTVTVPGIISVPV